MNFWEFLITLIAITTFGIIALAYIAGKYNLLAENKSGDNNGKK